MTSDGSLRGAAWFELALASAAAEALVDHTGPVVPQDVLIAGAAVGFSPDFAEAVLIDPASLAFLNDLWTSFEEQNGLGGLPAVLQRVLNRERELDAYGEDPWNVRVAHAAGYGWTDDDLAQSADVLMELSSRPFREEVAAAGATRGDGEPMESATEDWQVYLRAQTILILLRQDGANLILQVTGSTSGESTLVLKWPDAHQVVLPVRLAAGRPLRMTVENVRGDLPSSASVTA